MNKPATDYLLSAHLFPLQVRNRLEKEIELSSNNFREDPTLAATLVASSEATYLTD